VSLYRVVVDVWSEFLPCGCGCVERVSTLWLWTHGVSSYLVVVDVWSEFLPRGCGRVE